MSRRDPAGRRHARARARRAPPTSPGSPTSCRWSRARASMALAGPHLVKAVTGEDVDAGGARRREGPLPQVRASATSRSPTTTSASRRSRTTCPTSRRNCEEQPPIAPDDRPGRPHGRGAARRRARVSRASPYDMYEVIRRIVDDGEYFDIKPQVGEDDHHLLRALRRAAGRHRRQPAQAARRASSTNDSADKAARFVNLCDAFNIPLVFLQDVPGFMVGTKVEQEGIIRHGAKMLYAMSRRDGAEGHRRDPQGLRRRLLRDERARVRARPDRRLARRGDLGDGRRGRGQHHLPQADRGGGGPRGDDATELVENFKAIIDPYIAAGNDMVDDIIDPRETRPRIIRGLEMAATKRVERPWKKHGVMPV